MIRSFREWMKKKKTQTDEISSLPWVTGLNLKDKELWHLERVHLLLFLVERSQSMCFKYLMFLSSEHVKLQGDPWVDLGLLLGIIYLTWPGNALGTPRGKMNIWNTVTWPQMRRWKWTDGWKSGTSLDITLKNMTVPVSLKYCHYFQDSSGQHCVYLCPSLYMRDMNAFCWIWRLVTRVLRVIIHFFFLCKPIGRGYSWPLTCQSSLLSTWSQAINPHILFSNCLSSLLSVLHTHIHAHMCSMNWNLCKFELHASLSAPFHLCPSKWGQILSNGIL